MKFFYLVKAWFLGKCRCAICMMEIKYPQDGGQIIEQIFDDIEDNFDNVDNL